MNRKVETGMLKKRLTIGLTLMLIVIIFGSSLIAGILNTHKPANAAGPGDWSTYLYGPTRSGFNSAETTITPSTAGNLKRLWSISEGTTINTQPVVANGMIYWGSWDGLEHATNLNGTQVCTPW
jgi:outer membrane protein assembly factor BamB